MSEPSATVRPPLGLPSGSVRALLTLLIVMVVIVQLIRGREVDVLWAETLMIALAHYFTSRRFIKLSPEVVRRLTDEGQIEPEARPLYLPQRSIRFLIMAAFVIVAVWLFTQGRLFEQKTLSVLGVVFAYFLGMLLRLKRRQGLENFKAAVILGTMTVIALFYLADRADMVQAVASKTALAMVLFYFGSR